MINSEIELIGLIGNPVKHSKSPLMHNSMFDKLNLKYQYLAFNVMQNDLERAINGIKALNMKGANVTIPHKVEAMKFLDEISDEASQIGAVNTIVNHDGKLIGYNTDGEGYLKSLIGETAISLKGKKIMILGAGGAARAIAYTLSQQNIDSIIIINRNIEKAKDLKVIIESNTSTEIAEIADISKYIDNIDIIINTTSIGLYPNVDQTLIAKEWIKASHLVSDIIYNPLVTRLLADANEKGAMIHSGLGMFVYQGAIAFEKWTGIFPDTEFMRKTVIDSFKSN